MKQFKGLVESGRNISREFPGLYWNDIIKREDFKRGVKNEKLNPLEVFFIKMGFLNISLPSECPSPDDKFPFGKPLNKGKKFREVDPEYFRWFLKQDWKEKWPQVIAYCAFFKDGLKAYSIYLQKEDEEIDKMIDDMHNWGKQA